MDPSSDELLERAAERANIAHTIFMLLDADADGIVAVEQARHSALVGRLSRQTQERGGWACGGARGGRRARPRVPPGRRFLRRASSTLGRAS